MKYNGPSNYKIDYRKWCGYKAQIMHQIIKFIWSNTE